jgi:hypothetical protein
MCEESLNLLGRDITFGYFYALSLKGIGNEQKLIEIAAKTLVQIEITATDFNQYGYMEVPLRAMLNDSFLKLIGSVSALDERARVDFTTSCLSTMLSLSHGDTSAISAEVLYCIAKMFVTNENRREAVVVAKKLLAHSKERLDLQFRIMLEFGDMGITDDNLDKLSAKKAIVSLRTSPPIIYPLLVLLSYAYKKKKHGLVERLINRGRAYFMDDEQSYLQGRQYFMYRTAPEFFNLHVVNKSSTMSFHKLVMPRERVGDTVFLISCDDVYFCRAALQMIEKFYRWNDSTCLHINIVDPSDTTKTAIDAMTLKYPGLAYSFLDGGFIEKRVKDEAWGGIYRKTMYACSRFIVLPELMHLYQTTFVVLDADQDVLLPPQHFLKRLAENFKHDLAVKFNDHLLGPGRDCEIDITIFSYSTATNLFVKLLKSYILYFIEEDYPLWMLDQAGFLAVLTYLETVSYKPSLYYLNRDAFKTSDYFSHYGGMEIRT